MKKYIQEHKYVLLVLYLPIYLIWFALVERIPVFDHSCRCDAAQGRSPCVYSLCGVHHRGVFHLADNLHDLAELPAAASVGCGYEHAVRLAGQRDLFG